MPRGSTERAVWMLAAGLDYQHGLGDTEPSRRLTRAMNPDNIRLWMPPGCGLILTSCVTGRARRRCREPATCKWLHYFSETALMIEAMISYRFLSQSIWLRVPTMVTSSLGQ